MRAYLYATTLTALFLATACGAQDDATTPAPESSAQGGGSAKSDRGFLGGLFGPSEEEQEEALMRELRAEVSFDGTVQTFEKIIPIGEDTLFSVYLEEGAATQIVLTTRVSSGGVTGYLVVDGRFGSLDGGEPETLWGGSNQFNITTKKYFLHADRGAGWYDVQVSADEPWGHDVYYTAKFCDGACPGEEESAVECIEVPE